MTKLLMISILVVTQFAWADGSKKKTNNNSNNNSSSNLPSVNLDDFKANPDLTLQTDPIQKPDPNASIVGSKIDPITIQYPADSECTNAQNRVKTICIANNNPSINTAVSLLSKITAAGSAGLSMLDACSKFKEALNAANEALTVYNGACGAAGYFCQSTCTAAAAKHTSGADSSIAVADKSVANICAATMKSNLTNAAAGVAGIIGSSVLASSCKDDTTDKTATCDVTTNALCIAGVDCSNTANASNPACICNSQPNAPGCPGATSYGSSYTAPNFGATTTPATDSTTSSVTTTNSGLDAVTRNAAALPTAADGSTPASAGGGGGGGGGAVEGSGMSAAEKKSATADKKNALNPNILSGYDGGGGGGGGARGGSGSGSAYGAYMPGAAKDPSRSVAGAQQAAANAQVTSAGSKSNWEKVTERYSENKSTLMGE